MSPFSKKPHSLLRRPLGALFHLVYPESCVYCGTGLSINESILCSRCEFHLPLTGFHMQADNPVEMLFWGRTELVSATSLLYFQKGEMVQQLIHKLKYHQRSYIGVYLGYLLGQQLKESPRFNRIRKIIPVPLHPKKIKLRGYNQSAMIALGVARAMEVDTDFSSLFRKDHSQTQTKKSRYERWENVSKIFELAPSYNTLENCHILLVDDVITTGATIEACVNKLNDIHEIRVSVASLACPAL